MGNEICIEFGKKAINVKYTVVYNEDAGMYSAYMPGFDIYYSAPSEEEVTKRAKKMMDTFFDYWIQQEGWKQLFLKIHKLGFRTNMHNLAMKNFLRNKFQTGKFTPSNIIDIPEFFSNENNSKKYDAEAELAI